MLPCSSAWNLPGHQAAHRGRVNLEQLRSFGNAMAFLLYAAHQLGLLLLGQLELRFP